MADRRLYQDMAPFHPGEAVINLQFTAGASGAVPSRTATGSRFAGVATVVLTATGVYTVTFQDKWYSILGYVSGVYQATYNATHGGQFRSTPAQTLNTGVVLQCTTTDGVGSAVALTAGDVAWARFYMARIQGNG